MNVKISWIINYPFIMKALQPLIDILILVDVGVSIFYFILNPGNTIQTSIWFFLAWQMLFLPIILIVIYLQNKVAIINITSSLEKKIGQNFRIPLHYEMKDKDPNDTTSISNVENKLRLIQAVITFIFVIDLIIFGIFLLFGVFYEKSLGREARYEYIVYFLLNQPYYIAPIIFLLIIFIKLKTVEKQKTIYSHSYEKLPAASLSLFKKIKKQNKNMKLLIVIGILLVSVYVPMLYNAKTNKDEFQSEFNLTAKTQYTYISPYKITVNPELKNEMEIFAYTLKPNQYGQLSPHFSIITFDVLQRKILNDEILFDLDRARESVVDVSYDEQNIYVYTFRDDIFQFNLYRYSIVDSNFSKLFTRNLNIIQSSDYYANFSKFTYLLVPFDNGVHIIQTNTNFDESNTGSNIITISIINNKTSVSISKYSLFALDGITYNEKTYLLFINSTGDYNRFSLSIYDSTGIDFINSKNTTRLLDTYYSENIYGFPTPNSATLFEVGGNLYYRSTRNIYDISNSISSPYLYEFKDPNINFRYNSLQGGVTQNNLLILNSEFEFLFLDRDSLEKIESGYGYYSRFQANAGTNIILFNGSAITFSMNGKLYWWSTDPEVITNTRITYNNLILYSILTYLIGSIILFATRRKIH